MARLRDGHLPAGVRLFDGLEARREPSGPLAAHAPPLPTVRPPSLSSTKSLATLCAYPSPNCAFIRFQNSVSRTSPGYRRPRTRPARRINQCWPGTGVGRPGDHLARCVVIEYVGSTLSKRTSRSWSCAVRPEPG